MEYKVNPDGTITIIKTKTEEIDTLSADWMEYDDHKLFK